MKIKLRTAITLFLFLISFYLGAQQKKRSGYNVLFVFVDDLRPELGCYGSSYIHSPNLDAFAAHASVFKKQYVAVPTCGASRAAILTGMLPRRVQELSNEALEYKKTAKQVPAVPESFVHALRNSGYYTVGIGKISHSPDGYLYKYLAPKGTKPELPQSWDEMLMDAGKWGTGWNAFFGYSDGSNRNVLKGEVKPYENADVDDERYPDGLTARLAVSKLQELAGKGRPFFLGVGFFKPHLPFNAPRKYWDLYDESKISLTSSPDVPADVNTASLHESGEFNGYKKGEEKASLSKPVSDSYARKLRHAYYASVSYVDAQVGKVLSELKRLGLEKNTIVVVWGDHGWHLGDERVWGKHTLSEYALRSPLMIKVPGLKGGACDKIISSVDVYPTLMELCGLKAAYKTDGRSLLPLLKDPRKSDWENFAYSYYKRGISVRTDQYRLTRYFRKEEPSVELYDYRKHPFETKNVAASRPDLVKALQPVLQRGNTGLYDGVENEQKKQED